jgi:glycosyltransferase involved in cell wall biosynthesis
LVPAAIVFAMPARVTVLTGIFPPDIGGPATSVPELVRWLATDGWDPTVVTLADSLEEGAEAEAVVRIPRRLPWPRRTAAVVRAVRASRPDVVFANGLHLESALLRSAPVVQKVVGDWAWERARNRGWTEIGIDEFQRAQAPARVRALRALRGIVTRRARRVIVPSRHLAGLVQSWGVDPDRIRVVPNAAPANLSASTHERDAGRGVFLGRLVSWKNVDHAIAAISRLPHLRFDVVGAGPMLESLRSFTRSLGADERIRFHGALPREQALALLGGSSFLVLPSSYEGMPHVVLEAFAMGIPVVASNAPGIRAVVDNGRTGLLYRCGDVDDLRRALVQASKPEVAARLSREGLAAAGRLSLEASARAASGVLREVLR